MTIEQKEMLDEEIESAMASQDEPRLRRVMARYIMAIGDCQYKTSDRVKSVKASVEDVSEDIKHIKEEIRPMKKSHEQYQADRAERRGATQMLQLIKWAVTIVGSGGLGAGVMKFLSTLN